MESKSNVQTVSPWSSNYAKVRSLEIEIKNVVERGGKPSPELIAALEKAQGELLGQFSMRQKPSKDWL